MIKNITLKLTLLSLAAGMALIPHKANAMNLKKALTYGALSGSIVTGIGYIGSKLIEYNQTEEQLNKQLLKAAGCCNLENIKNCLYHGANKEITDKNGNTPLMVAILGWDFKMHCTPIIKYLVHNGVNIEAKNDRGWTPLICACDCDEYEFAEAVEFLIEAGATIDRQDNDGKTALIHAIENGNIKSIKFLIDAGTNPYIKDRYGEDAYDHAIYTDVEDYFTKISNEITRFKTNPMKLTVDAPLIPKLQKDICLKMIYRGYPFKTTYNDLHCIFAKFYNSGNNEELKKVLKKCDFSKCSKEELKKLNTIGFPLSAEEFIMQENLLKNTKKSTFFDFNFFYSHNK